MSLPANTCPSCSAAVADGRFCRRCGAPLQQTAQRRPATPEPPQAPMAQQLPPAYPPPFPPPTQPAPQRYESRALAVVLATTVMIVLLGAAAMVILLVANDGPSNAGTLTQSTLSSPTGQSPASAP